MALLISTNIVKGECKDKRKRMFSSLALPNTVCARNSDENFGTYFIVIVFLCQKEYNETYPANLMKTVFPMVLGRRNTNQAETFM